ncbi:hypothetical protein ACJX0J_006318 [Zea mays]
MCAAYANNALKMHFVSNNNNIRAKYLDRSFVNCANLDMTASEVSLFVNWSGVFKIQKCAIILGLQLKFNMLIYRPFTDVKIMVYILIMHQNPVVAEHSFPWASIERTIVLHTFIETSSPYAILNVPTQIYFLAFNLIYSNLNYHIFALCGHIFSYLFHLFVLLLN